MLRDEINKALEVLKNGGIILYPTDTVWGLGCDATNKEAVAKVNELKGRPIEKSLIILLDNDNKLQSYVQEVPEVAYSLLEFAETPLTIVFSDAKNLAQNVVNIDGSIGIRIPKHDFCQQLLQRFRKPIVSTSANVSGQPTPAFFDEISDEIKDSVDYIVDLEQEDRTVKKPSTIVKLGPSGEYKLIRK
jgi:L-threonylcarbamoyladenylate synthase